MDAQLAKQLQELAHATELVTRSQAVRLSAEEFTISRVKMLAKAGLPRARVTQATGVGLKSVKRAYDGHNQAA
ncbi:hypothetical protein [Gordonia malaquae]|uniref:hypothetical protein n=1 Tax=Gordonia malaquae TaxID=410332 RepID=UPI003017ECF8